jgi:hypothetical protein
LVAFEFEKNGHDRYSFTKYARYITEVSESIRSVKIQEVARCLLESRRFVKKIGVVWEIGEEEACFDLF